MVTTTAVAARRQEAIYNEMPGLPKSLEQLEHLRRLEMRWSIRHKSLHTRSVPCNQGAGSTHSMHQHLHVMVRSQRTLLRKVQKVAGKKANGGKISVRAGLNV